LAAPRVWWLFRTMGAKNVFVLDGGLTAGRPKAAGETDLPAAEACDLPPKFERSR
jgi:thiosulfate/3-mercaptopyruvate sulfurtransferase